MTEKRPLTLPLFMARLLSGFVGGIAGTLSLFIVFFLTNGLLPGTESTAISVFALIVMAFIGTTVANVMAGLTVTFVDNTKYNRRKTILVHLFMFNVIFFLFSIPFYLIGISLDVVNGVAAMHFLLSAFISALLMEIIAGYEYSVVGIYSTSLGILLSIGLAMLAVIFKLKTIVLLFMAMPVVWILLQISGGFVELIYDVFIHYYGIEALSIKTDLGGDSEKEPQDDNEMVEGVDKEDGT